MVYDGTYCISAEYIVKSKDTLARSQMKATIIICTYRRPAEARRLLIELKEQRYKNFEVLVVYQGEKADIGKIKSPTETFYPIKYFYEVNPNLPRARNIGIREASGEIVLFLDDDIKPGNNLVEAHIKNHADSKVGIVGGKVLEDKDEGYVPDSKIGTVRKIDGFAYSGFDKNVKREVMHVKGGNMSVRRGVALEIGGFDERFEGIAEYEDMDFCLRVLKRGYKIIFEPAAVVKHFSLPFGGCRGRERSKEEQIYWLYRNHSLMFLNNFSKLSYPILIAEYILRISLRSLLWRNPRIIGSMFLGIRDGWKAHFSKPPKISWNKIQ